LEGRRKKRDNDLEDRRKELEIKVEIVSKMDETIRNRVDKALSLQALSLTSKTKERPTEDEQIAEVENVKKWYMLEAKSIESKLDTYFPETNLDDRWDYYARTLKAYIMALLVI
jgi:hypothetical protein